ILQIDCGGYKQHKQSELHCPENHAPVCGTDGLTYDNECMLCITIIIFLFSCGSEVDLAHEGKCVSIFLI
uniref:Kazal-like domain-containing protein n=1 Tax=Varanus komodoensis TaxID=61221 RepID=A0A8D2L9M8_VARKO